MLPREALEHLNRSFTGFLTRPVSAESDPFSQSPLHVVVLASIAPVQQLLQKKMRNQNNVWIGFRRIPDSSGMGILEGSALGGVRGSTSLACPSSLSPVSLLMLCMSSRELVSLSVEGSLGLSFNSGWHPSR